MPIYYTGGVVCCPPSPLLCPLEPAAHTPMRHQPRMWPLLVRITTPTHIPCMYLYYIDPI